MGEEKKMTYEALLKWVREDLIFRRLKLSDMGFSIDEIQEDTILFGDVGLSLDSIDGLELAVGIEQQFGLKIGKLTSSIAREKFHSPRTITDFILELQQASVG
ncbi:acyl carrier protein [bacterium]|nr:acyl carrier protein [bacterium]